MVAVQAASYPRKTVATDTELLAALDALPALDRALVEVLAVAFEARGRTFLCNAVRRLGHNRGPDGKSLTTTTLTPLLASLSKLQLVRPDRAGDQCPPVLAKALMVRLERTGRLPAVVAAVAPELTREAKGLWALRVALYAKDFAGAARLLAGPDLAGYDPLGTLLENEFDERWLRTWPESIQTAGLSSVFEDALLHMTPSEAPYATLAALCNEGAKGPELRALYAVQLALRASITEASRWLEGESSPGIVAAKVWQSFVQGDTTAACALTEGLSPAALSTLTGKLGWIAGILAWTERRSHVVALQRVRQGEAKCRDEWWRSLLETLALPATVASDPAEAAYTLDSRLSDWWPTHLPPLVGVFHCVARGWFDLSRRGLTKRSETRDDVSSLRAKVESAGYRWLVTELDDVLALIDGGPETPRGRLHGVVSRDEEWQRGLEALEGLSAAPAPSVVQAKESLHDRRLAWVLELRGTTCDLRPVEQKRDGKGRWTQGRRVALERVYGSASEVLEYLGEQDRAILRCLGAETHRVSGYPETYYTFDDEAALRAMIGHPRVYLEGDPLVQVELVEEAPSLIVKTEGDWIALRFVPRIVKDQRIGVRKLSATRVGVTFVSEALGRYAEVIGEGLRVPLRESARVERLLAPLSSVVSVENAIGAAKVECE